MTLRDALAAGTFSVTAELNPPADPVAEPVRRTAAQLKGLVAAANVTDNAAATVKVAPLAAATWMIEEGLEPIMQVTTRDRNIMALQSELLAAWALGVRNILALSGDPLKVGKYADLATKVSDLDSLGLVRLIRQLNDGRLAAGETLGTPTGFYVASAMNPLVDTGEKIEAKIVAGTQFFQSNIVYDVPRFASWFAPLVEGGTVAGIPVLVGVMPPRSSRALEHMHKNIPGVEVDDATFARLAGLTGDEAKEAGVAVAADVITALREVPGVSGVHIMAPGWEAEAVTRVVHATGLEASTI
ncbi:methylenetetrahydrofolate reductase [Trebonia sp.]|uniref:methylenetetrahydrofolate reductase n=1 Tax=Trebonia sp. TaxID=2767075 RepID=UPI002629D0B3|nr:methylenetetrahydrofolate reductase [Trebonia sp.]